MSRRTDRPARAALPLALALSLLVAPAALAQDGGGDEQKPADEKRADDDAKPDDDGDDGGKGEAPPDTDPAVEKAIETKLITVLFPKATPYQKVIEAVRRETNVNIHVSAKAAFAAEGTVFNLMARDTLAKDVLDQVAAKINCTWEIHHAVVYLLQKDNPRQRLVIDKVVERVDLSYLEWEVRKPIFEERFTITWRDSDLSEALAELTEKSGVPFKIDEASMLPDEFVTVRIRKARGVTLLQLIAEQVDGELVAEPKAIVVYKRGATKKK